MTTEWVCVDQQDRQAKLVLQVHEYHGFTSSKAMALWNYTVCIESHKCMGLERILPRIAELLIMVSYLCVDSQRGRDPPLTNKSKEKMWQ